MLLLEYRVRKISFRNEPWHVLILDARGYFKVWPLSAPIFFASLILIYGIISCRNKSRSSLLFV